MRLIAGPMLPTALFILGIFYWRIGLTPRWTAGSLCIAAALFPVARVVRSDVIAIGADLLMLLVFVAVARSIWPRSEQNGDAPAA